MAQYHFERLEKKYLITGVQAAALLQALGGKIRPDRYGKYTICNIYYDTDQFDLIRASIDKPVYKEKLRLRSYGTPTPGSSVFLELKKKYDGVVYKRRVAYTVQEGGKLLARYGANTRQVMQEILYFSERYPVSPKAFISYDRAAYQGAEDDSLRITLDSNLRFRDTDLRLEAGGWGRQVLAPGQVLLEIKQSGNYPGWLSRALSELAIYPASFSKYGVCYKRFLLEPAGGRYRKGERISA